MIVNQKAAKRRAQHTYRGRVSVFEIPTSISIPRRVARYRVPREHDDTRRRRRTVPRYVHCSANPHAIYM